jgi:hypothetical protein
MNPRAGARGRGGKMECLRKRLRMVKEIVIRHYYRFYPPSLIYDYALNIPLPEDECKIVAKLLESEFDEYGTYLAFLNYYINTPYDAFLSDGIEKLRILIMRYKWRKAA